MSKNKLRQDAKNAILGENYHKRVGSFIGKMLEKPSEQVGDKLTLKLNSIDHSFGHNLPSSALPSNGNRTIYTNASHTRYNSIRFNNEQDSNRGVT